MGGLGMIAQGLIFTAAPHCQAAHATLIGSSEIVWSYIWQLVLLHQPSDRTSLTGATLILASFVLPIVSTRQHARGGWWWCGTNRMPPKAKTSGLHLATLEESTEQELERLATPATADVLHSDN
mmetsp:Transcript_21401/g.57622  ORF Transcript_21401/g.57622 Transcript_21401/m.57622 type:complete len:124 (+) Transcript_21401:2-373(+)